MCALCNDALSPGWQVYHGLLTKAMPVAIKVMDVHDASSRKAVARVVAILHNIR
jgi:hypothetical protein